MTWRTEIGERTLQGAEAKLVREAIGVMSDVIWDEVRTGLPQWSFGVRVFDQLESPARLAMLLEVGTALLCETPACPPLTAISEGTVAAIFGHVRQAIEFEIDDGRTTWREDVLAAMRETDPDWDDLPRRDCDDPMEWAGPIDSLEERILWDLDFEDGDQFLEPVSKPF